MTIAASLLIGCGPRIVPPHPLSILDDPYAANVVVRGVGYFDHTTEIWGDWQLRTGINRKTGVKITTLVATFGYSGPIRHYNRAGDDTGTALPVTPIERERGSCSHNICDESETVAILVNLAQLRARAATKDYTVKFFARSGDTYLIYLPLDAIDQQLAAIAKLSGGT